MIKRLNPDTITDGYLLNGGSGTDSTINILNNLFISVTRLRAMDAGCIVALHTNPAFYKTKLKCVEWIAV